MRCGMDQRLGLAEMPRQVLVHLEHRDILRAKHLLQLVVGEDLALGLCQTKCTGW